MSARQLLRSCHLVIGLVAALWLVGLGVSGALLEYESEIDDFFDGPAMRVTPSGTALPLATLESAVAAARPGLRITQVALPADGRHLVTFTLGDSAGTSQEQVGVDPYTGAVRPGARPRDVLRTVHQFHTRLVSLPAGSTIQALASLLLVGLSCSGLILWWRLRLFRVRPGGSARRQLFDLHSATGLYTCVFLALFGVTGALVHWSQPVAAFIDRLAGAREPDPIPTAAPACTGQPELRRAELLRRAEAEAPGARPVWLVAHATDQPVRVSFKYPEDLTPAGRTQVFLEPCSGKVLMRRLSRSLPPGITLTTLWNRPLHTGEMFGWPGRIVALLMSLSLPLMAVTGPLIWWNRRRRGPPAP